MFRARAARLSLITAFALSAMLLISAAKVSFGAPPNEAQAGDSPKASAVPDLSSVPAGPLGDSIRLGLNVFNDTPKYAEKYVGNRMSCTHCHIDGGTVSKGMPMIGLPGIFPLYRDREKTVITFEERIQQCFQRSEFGHRLPNDGAEMTGLVAYAQWLSKDQVTGHAYSGRGLVDLPELNGDAKNGARIYAGQCAVCHGAEGKGNPPAVPALWGPDSYSDGAGMNQIPKMAAFVQHNMPQNEPGTLTPQEAYDVATYVHSKPHSQFVMKEHMALPD
jgi:thiosulfate dehydrogenase